MQSTICHFCKPPTEAIALFAQSNEIMWEKDPVDVEERVCRNCKTSRHWWFYFREDKGDPRGPFTGWQDERLPDASGALK